jgi:hypothetical protein
VDAYIPPYIPFQLTTVEFFTEARDHLSPDGVLAINVARTETNYALVDAVASTLKHVYPSVFVLDTLADLNSIVFALPQPIQLADVEATLSTLHDPILADVTARSSGRIREFAHANRRPLTDDLAPVEQIVHTILAGFVFG